MIQISWEAPKDPELQRYLEPTEYCEPHHPEIQRVTAEVVKGAKTSREAAIKIYFFIRDEIKFHLGYPTPSIEVLRSKRGWCWPKANLQVAMLRAAKIPARYRAEPYIPFALALSTPEEFWEFIWDQEPIHGLAEVYLNGEWVGCDATTDKDLMPSAFRFDWDGEHDLTTILPWRKSVRGTPSSCPVKELTEAFEAIPPESFDIMNEHMNSIRSLPDDKKYRLYLDIYGKTFVKYIERQVLKWKEY